MSRIVQSVFVAAALLTGGALTASVEPIQAAAGSNCTYYSDASHTTVVGEFGKDCCNNQVARGHKTQYSVCSSACLPCVPPPQD